MSETDQTLDAAWRRCEAALPKGMLLVLHAKARTLPPAAVAHNNDLRIVGEGDTPAEALTALAEELEAKP